MKKLTVALVQTDPGPDKEANVSRALELVAGAAAAGADLVALPETFHFRGPNEARREAAEPIPGPLTERLSAAAKQHRVFLLSGSYNELHDDESDTRTYNTSQLFGPDGALLGYALYAFMGVPTLGLAIIGVALGYLFTVFMKKQEA